MYIVQWTVNYTNTQISTLGDEYNEDGIGCQWAQWRRNSCQSTIVDESLWQGRHSQHSRVQTFIKTEKQSPGESRDTSKRLHSSK